MSFGRSCVRTDAPKQLSYASASRFDTMLDSVESSKSVLPWVSSHDCSAWTASWALLRSFSA